MHRLGRLPSRARHYRPTYFSQAEWEFLHATVDLLIPSDQFGAGRIETGLPEFLDRQMRTDYAAGKLWFVQGPCHRDQVPEIGIHDLFDGQGSQPGLLVLPHAVQTM